MSPVVAVVVVVVVVAVAVVLGVVVPPHLRRSAWKPPTDGPSAELGGMKQEDFLRCGMWNPIFRVDGILGAFNLVLLSQGGNLSDNLLVDEVGTLHDM